MKNYPLVSAIITTKNEEHNINNCMDSVLKQDYPGENIEIIVIDNNSSDKTKEIACSYTDKIYNFGPERSAQRNFGVKISRGKYILYLDSDMILSEGVVLECVDKCETQGKDVLYIPERITGSGFWIRVRDFERGFYNATAIDCVRFIRRDKFLESGGFDESLTGPEDWDFSRRIKDISNADIINAPIYHNEGRFNLRKYLGKKYYYSAFFDNYIKKWGGNDPVIKQQLGLKYRYFGVFIEENKWKKFFAHPLLALGMYLLRFLVGVVFLMQRNKFHSQCRGNAILILTPFYEPNIGGVESYLSDLCSYLNSSNQIVYVLTYQPLTTNIKAPRFQKTGDLEIRRLPWIGNNLFHKLERHPLLEFLYLTPGLFIYAFLFMAKNKNKVRVIHTQGFAAAFIGKFLAAAFNKKIIASTCAVYDLKPKSMLSKIVKWILWGYDEILALGEFSRKELISIGLPENKINKYHLWVDQTKYAPLNKAKAKNALNMEGRFIVLYVGRFIKIKGIEILVEVAKIADKKINFVFIGDSGPCLGLLEKVSMKFSNVILVKGIRALELIPYYQAADILVVPSQYDEAFGKVIIEALSCGTPVLGSDRGAIPSILDSSVGRITEPTIEAIKSQIEDLYKHPDVLSRLTLNCRPYAQRYFSENNIEVITNSYL